MAEPPTEDAGFPLAEMALDMVRRGPEGGERFVLHPQGREVIKAGVKALLLSDETTVRKARAIRQALALCVVLEEREHCPGAAQAVAEALLSDPAVAALLGGKRDAHAVKAKQYRQFVDARDVERAPQVDAKAPDGSMKLRSFINPGQERTRRSATGPAQAPETGPQDRPDASKPRSAPPRRRGFKT